MRGEGGKGGKVGGRKDRERKYRDRIEERKKRGNLIEKGERKKGEKE